MAPRPGPFADGGNNDNTDSIIHSYCVAHCQPVPNYDECYTACWQFRKAIQDFLPPPPSSSSKGSAQTKLPWMAVSGASQATGTATGNYAAYGAVQTSTATGSSTAASATATLGSETTNMTTNADGQPFNPSDNDHHNLGPYLTAASIVVPILIVALFLLAVFTIIRWRKKRRAARNAEESEPLSPSSVEQPMRQMSQNTTTIDAYIRRPSLGDPFADPPNGDLGAAFLPRSHFSVDTESVVTRNDNHHLPSTVRDSQPVILSNTIDRNYFTGIDTADTVSIAAPSTSGDIYPSNDDEEPPPPYRPRSVPPISREQSLRQSLLRNAACIAGPCPVPVRHSSQRTATCEDVREEGEEEQYSNDDNPFDDPDEEEQEGESSAAGACVPHPRPISTDGIGRRSLRRKGSDVSSLASWEGPIR